MSVQRRDNIAGERRGAGEVGPRRLVLIRHAKSAWPRDVSDHDRPLAPRGRRAAPAAGRWLRDAGCVPELVLCSTAVRARDTWLLAAAELGARPPVRYERDVYQASAAGLLGLVRGSSDAVGTVLIVGHDPGVSDLALGLVGGLPSAERGRGAEAATGSGTAAADRLAQKFPTGAIAILQFEGSWRTLGKGRVLLTAFVTPREMASRRR